MEKKLDNINYLHSKGFMIGCHQNINTDSLNQLKKTILELKKIKI